MTFGTECNYLTFNTDFEYFTFGTECKYLPVHTDCAHLSQTLCWPVLRGGAAIDQWSGWAWCFVEKCGNTQHTITYHTVLYHNTAPALCRSESTLSTLYQNIPPSYTKLLHLCFPLYLNLSNCYHT